MKYIIQIIVCNKCSDSVRLCHFILKVWVSKEQYIMHYTTVWFLKRHAAFTVQGLTYYILSSHRVSLIKPEQTHCTVPIGISLWP